MKRTERLAALQKCLASRILLLDGAMGTAIQDLNLTDADFGGKDYAGCNEFLVITRPDVIEGIHRAYLEAGADIVETDTFGGTPMVLAEFGLGERAYEINRAASEIARRAADALSTVDKPRFVAGSIGPTTKAISVTGGITFAGLIAQFKEQARGLYDGGCDYFLLETCNDTLTVKAGLIALREFLASVNEPIPIAVSCTIERSGTMLAGQAIDAFAAAMEYQDLLYIGLNCATGPAFMTDHLRTLSALTGTRVACVPNAGLPDENGRYLETPQLMTNVLEEFAKQGWLNLLGGCCGTTAEHIRAFAQLTKSYKPRTPVARTVSTLSGIEYLEVTDEKRPLLVGERTNVLGSRKFKEVIDQGEYEKGAEIARAQVRKGAHIIDICLQDPDRDEMGDMVKFLEKATKMVKAPLMIDSTDFKIMEKSLEYCQGKAILNSINLEDGEERFEKVVPLAHKFGAALVVGCIDEDPDQGMAVTRDRKLAVAQRSFDLLTKKYGMKAQDLYFDALVFPCATGDKQYIGSAVETIEGVRLIKEKFPLCKTALGISNVSFGLPPAGREVLNSVFLYHCTKAGLDLAIVNTERLERYPSIPEEERRLSENLLWNKTPDCIEAFTAHFRVARKTVAADARKALPLAERLAQCIIQGTKDGLEEDLAVALKTAKPLEVINGPLMAGMDEVGRLFNDNQLIVAEVLQSAEAMKSAVRYLEQFMEKNTGSGRGKVILATVKGDVHDIGKNLVEIILKNNGFNVVNLGIKVTPEQLIAAVQEHKPDVIGLSGLLVKSAQQMVITAEDLHHAGFSIPILVGGAALTRKFTDTRIAPAYGQVGTVEYANDAMTGLSLAKRIVDKDDFEKLKGEISQRRGALQPVAAPSVESESEQMPTSVAKPVAVLSSDQLPKPPDYVRHVHTNDSVDEIWRFVNDAMVYRAVQVSALDVARVKRGERNSSEKGLAIAWEMRELLEEIKVECRKGILVPKAVYQFVKAVRVGDTVQIFNSPDATKPAAQFLFPRQKDKHRLSLADYVAPAGDALGLFVVTVGPKFKILSEAYKEKGDYRKMALLDALATETAEAYAEMLHARMRYLWGFPDDPNLAMKERLQAKYRGKRYSFGYAACPNLEDQAPLFDLLKPADIGVHLTEGFMMEPEASVSALVFHHPQAVYFKV